MTNLHSGASETVRISGCLKLLGHQDLSVGRVEPVAGNKLRLLASLLNPSCKNGDGRLHVHNQSTKRVPLSRILGLVLD